MPNIKFALLPILLFCLFITKAYSQEQTAFDRIIKTNTLRCGYAVATPWFMIDANTKKMSGVGYDVTNAVAEKMGVKIDWAEETGWGTAEQGLVSKRYDMVCGSVCIDPRRARAATFSTPFVHVPVLAIVRGDDAKFAKSSLTSLNEKSIRIGVKNGDIFEAIANARFPKATKIYANDLGDNAEFLLMLTSKKIDVAFAGQDTIDRYLKTNSDKKLKSIEQPAHYCNAAFMVPLGDFRLKAMVDNAIMEINTSGQISNIIGSYMPLDPRYAVEPAKPFRE